MFFATRIFKIIRTNINILLGLTMLIAILLLSFVGSLFIQYDPLRMGLFPPNSPPSFEHILGTDTLGRDVFAQMLVGIKHSIMIGFIVATIGTIVGASIGFLAGYCGGIVDTTLRFITDIFVMLPMLPILILVACFVKIIEIWMMALILSIFAWAWPARQIRSNILSLKERDFIYLAKLSGMSTPEILFQEILPHMFQYLTASFVYSVLWAIMAEVGLEILGLGPQHTITIGMILYWAFFHAAVFRGIWWWIMPPIFAIMWILVSLYLLHVGIDELINPRLRGG